MFNRRTFLKLAGLSLTPSEIVRELFTEKEKLGPLKYDGLIIHIGKINDRAIQWGKYSFRANELLCISIDHFRDEIIRYNFKRLLPTGVLCVENANGNYIGKYKYIPSDFYEKIDFTSVLRASLNSESRIEVRVTWNYGQGTGFTSHNAG